MSRLGLLRLLLGVFIILFALIGLIIGLNVPFAIMLIYALTCYFIVNLKGHSKAFFILFTFAAAFCIRLACILLIDTPPESDFKIMYDAAISFSKGDYSFNNLIYFRHWAYQTGFVIYQGIIVKLFGVQNALLAIKIVNVLFSSGSCVLIYLILARLVKEKTARFCAFLSAGLIFPATFVTVLSNQHVSAFFMLMGLFFAGSTSMKGWMRSISAGLAFGISNILRPEGIIVITSLFLVSLIIIFKKKREGKHIFLQTVLLIAVYLAVNNLASIAIKQTGVNPEGLKNNNVLWKFVTGLNHESKGAYSKKDADLIYDGMPLTDQERREIQIKLIKERLGAGPKKLISLFINKQYNLWAGNPAIWSFKYFADSNKSVVILGNDLSFSEISQYVHEYHKLQLFALVLLSISGAISYKKTDIDFMLYYLMMLCITGVYFLIEVQARYIYLPEILLAITSAKGIEAIESSIGKIKV